MSFPLLINSTNYVSNNTYRVDLSNTIDLTDYSVSVGQAYVYYSWYNISIALNNNKYQITFPTSLGSTTTTVNINPGLYNINDLNNQLQYFFISQGYYLINNITGYYTYYAAFQLSPTGYSVQFITNPLPISLPSGFTSGGMTFPVIENQHPQLTLLSTNEFKDIIGYTVGTYPTVPTNVGIQTSESVTPPNVSPISAIQMRLSCCYNPFSSNSTLLHVFNSQGSSVGTAINASPIQLQYVPCQGSHMTITLQFFDQLGRVLDMLDRNILIKLIFKKNTLNIEDETSISKD